jgi:hypothetical protein
MMRVQIKVRGRLTRAQRGSSGEAAADTRTLEHVQKALMEFLLLWKVET